MAPTTVPADHEFARILTPPHQQQFVQNIQDHFLTTTNDRKQQQQQLDNNNQIIDSQNLNHHPDTRQQHTLSSIIGPNKTNVAAQFLPICDLMFNLISMIAYFCDSTFNIIAFFALYQSAQTRIWAHLGLTFICFSSLISQSLSLKWSLKTQFQKYKRKIEETQNELEDDLELAGYSLSSSSASSSPSHPYHIHIQNHMTSTSSSSGGQHQVVHNSRERIPGNSAAKIRSDYYMAILFEAVIHCAQGGILFRYIRLVIPVDDTTTVKNDARDLCILRMCHAFLQSAPLLLFQTYIIWSRTSPTSISSLSITSVLLSLFSVCWALASFTKYVREKFLQRFVLTWLGVITQFLWRLGTVSSRIVALTIYAVHYGYWVVIVLILHWSSMFLWLLLPNNLLRDEKDLNKSKKFFYAGITAWVYCFCYLNYEERNSKQKMFIYYLLMFLENNLLLSVCVGFSSLSYIPWFRNLSILTIYLGFITGIAFMFIYYRHFHVNVLDSEFSQSNESLDSIAEQLSAAGKKIAGYKSNSSGYGQISIIGQQYSNNLPTLIGNGSQLDIGSNLKGPALPCNMPLAGVFSCKFNPAFTKQTKRKKKMPTSHIQTIVNGSIRDLYGQVQN